MHGDKFTLALTLKQATNFLTSLAFVIHIQCTTVGRVIVVGIATCCGQGGLRIESRRGWGSLYPSRWAPMPTQPPCMMDIASLSWFKAARDGLDHPIYLAPKLKKEWSCTSTPLLELNGMLWGEVYSIQCIVGRYVVTSDVTVLRGILENKCLWF